MSNVDIKTLKDWAEFYKELRVWVSPCKDVHTSFYREWKPVKNDNDYMTLFDQTDWNTKDGIELITGKKGSMVVIFRKDEESNYSKQSLLRVLSILELPEDYDWVIESFHSYAIVLDVHSLPIGKIKKEYRDLHISWEDYYLLPPGIERYKCWFTNGLPRKHPEAIPWSVFVEKLQEIDKLHLLVDDIVRAERRKREIIGKSIAGILLVVVIGVITGVVAMLNNADFDTWVWMFVATLAAAIGLIWMMSC